MVSHGEITAQLNGLGLKFRFFGRKEVDELPSIINPGEQIRHCVYGSYQGGSGLLVATDRRILLIDKRPFFLNIEDFRYEMLSDVYFAGRMLNAAVSLNAGTKELRFVSISDARLRKLYTYTQDQITTARQLEQAHEAVKPASSSWSPYTLLLGRPRASKFSGRLIARKLLSMRPSLER